MNIKNKTTIQKNIFYRIVLFLFFVFNIFIFSTTISLAADWKNKPLSCPYSSGGITCGSVLDNSRVCGVSGSNVKCYADMSGIEAPVSSIRTQDTYQSTYSGGFIINCEADDGGSSDPGAPACDNGSSYNPSSLWCNESVTCRGQSRNTECSGGWATTPNTAGSGTIWSCLDCKSGFHNCNTTNDDCEVVDGISCTTSEGLAGVISGCNGSVGLCIPNALNFQTGVETSYYTTSSPLLWGVQNGSGELIRFSNSSTQNVFVVHNDGVLEITSTTAPIVTINKLYNIGGTLYWNGIELGGGTPAGSNKEIQFNNSGSFGATSTFVWDNGRLGIGTNNPSSKLTVFSDHGINTTSPSLLIKDMLNEDDGLARISLQSADKYYLDIYSRVEADESFAGMLLKSLPSQVTFDGGDFNIGSSVANVKLNFLTNSSTRMTILNNGNVGIGTINPSSKLTIFDASTSTFRMTNSNIANFEISSYDGVTDINYDSADDSNILKFSKYGLDNVLVLNSDGKVGVGLSGTDVVEKITTDGNFAVYDKAEDRILSLMSYGAAIGGLMYKEQSTGIIRSGIQFDDKDVYIYASNTPRMSIRSDGKVGIGTVTSPILKLSLGEDGGIHSYTSGIPGGISGIDPLQGDILPNSVNTSSQMFWYPRKAAFRAGALANAVSNNDAFFENNIGLYSAVFGLNNEGSGVVSFIGGGVRNTAAGLRTFIGGGISNNLTASSSDSFIAAGSNNVISAKSSLVSGGSNNVSGDYSSIIGGYDNVVSGLYSFIGGGFQNQITANYSTVFGREMTVSGDYSFGINLNDPALQVTLSQANTMAIMGGKLGIGTTTPSSKLHIEDSNGGDIIKITGQNFNDEISLGFNTTSNFSYLNGDVVGSDRSFKIISGSGYYWAQFNVDGSVGIGQNSASDGYAINTDYGNVSIDDGSFLVSGTTGVTPVSGAGTRMMWVPSKSAFRAGVVTDVQWDATNIGSYSIAVGRDVKASGLGSVSFGRENIVSGNYASAIGYQNTASGLGSFAIGNTSIASGSYSFALGYSNTIASGSWGAVAMGYGSLSSGLRGPISLGRGNTASGEDGAIALGFSSVASGNFGAVALGDGSISSGNLGAIALGFVAKAYGTSSIAIGHSVTASGEDSFAMGNNIKAIGKNTVAIGLFGAGVPVECAQNNSLCIMGGNVGIGTTTPQYALEVKSNTTNIARFTGSNASSCTLSSTGIIACSSDVRLKKNITEITGQLENIMNLNPVLYNWNSQPDSESKNASFIAQELEEIYPNLVMTEDDENAYKSISMIGMIPYIVSAIQEQQNQISAISVMNTSSQSIFSSSTFADDLTIEGDVNFIAKAEFKSHIYFSENNIGRAKILPGFDKVRITFTEDYTVEPVITVTPVGLYDFNYGVDKIDINGFEIVISEAQDEEVIFNWHSFATNKLKMFISDGMIEVLYDSESILVNAEDIFFEDNNQVNEEEGSESEEENIEDFITSTESNFDNSSSTDSNLVEEVVEEVVEDFTTSTESDLE